LVLWEARFSQLQGAVEDVFPSLALRATPGRQIALRVNDSGFELELTFQ